MAANNPSVRRDRLEDRAFASQGHVTIPTKGKIPKGRRVTGLEFTLDGAFTQPGAGNVAQLGSVMAQMIAQITYGRRYGPISGLGLTLAGWARRGYELDFPAGIPAGAPADVLQRSIYWSLDFADPTARDDEVSDGSIPTELFEKYDIEVDFGSPAAIFAATAPTFVGTLRTTVVHDSAGDVAHVPSPLVMKDENFAALTANINRKGKYLLALLYRLAANDSGNVTDVQVASVASVVVGGEPILKNVQLQDLCLGFNRMRAQSQVRRLESQTVPVSGSALTSQPGVAAAAAATVTAEFLPLIYQPRKYQLAQVPEGDLVVDLTGTIGAYRIVTVMVEPRTDAAIASIAAAQGVSAGNVFPKAKGIGGGPVSDLARRFGGVAVRK
jgi:hypothetical protein